MGEIQLSLGEDVDGDTCLTTGEDEDYKDFIDIPDSGSWVVPAGTIQLDDPEAPASKSCDATWTLTRSTQGTYPTELETGGSVEALVERTVSFVSVQ